MNTQNIDPDGYWFCPLFYFNADQNSIKLAENTKIEKLEHLPSPIKEYMHNRGTRSQEDLIHLLTIGAATAKWAIWLPGNGNPSLNSGFPNFPPNKEAEMIIDSVTALRLRHLGEVMPGEIVFFSLVPNQPGIAEMRSETYMSMRNDIWFGEPNYTLKDLDIPEVNILIKLIGKWKTQAAIDIATRRFNLSYSNDLEGRIIDQIIAFESLYLGNEPELRYKLALRTAFLLGETIKKRREAIFDTIYQAYKIRNNIVHGSNLEASEQDKLLEIMPKTEEYLRQSIRKFIKLLDSDHSLNTLKTGKDKKPALLDENILKNGTLLA